MTTIFKPLLSATIEDTSKLSYPAIVSPKLDGIRCLIINGIAVSRSLKPIRNKRVQAFFGKAEYKGLDGELIVGDPCSKTCYRDTYSGVMSEDGEPDVWFHVFDRFDSVLGFVDRYASLPRKGEAERIVRVPHRVVSTETQLLEVENEYLDQGYEGLMVRSPTGSYKQGRSMLRDEILGKLKRFTDAEYQIVGFQERMHNANEAKTNALGHTERSMHKENMIGRGDLGALVLRYDGGTFTCGTGFDDKQRAEIWANKDSYLGKIAKVKQFAYGVKDAPRFPVWLGFRDPIDM